MAVCETGLSVAVCETGLSVGVWESLECGSV